MRKITGLQTALIILISLLAGYYFGVNKVSLDWKAYSPKVNVISKEPPADVTSIDFTPFWTVWQKLQTDYYDKTKLDSSKMLTGAINGMIQTLGDPFTLYLPPTQNNDFKQGLSGQFEGIGAELGTKDKSIIVIAPLDGSPARAAGIKAGDEIVKVNDEVTGGWTLAQAVDKIRGPKGTDVTLTIVRKDTSGTKDIKITRDVITVKSVTSWIKKVKDIEGIKVAGDFAIAYIRLSQFGDNTNKEWLSVTNDLVIKIKQQNAKGLILDVRNNPGGYLTDATYIASEFIKEGAPVVIEEAGGVRTTLSATRKGLLLGTPLIVLINKGSASASEIVAGALRDNNRARLVGETSFGKGTVQQAEDLGGGAGLHVTIAKWLTPSGVWINGKGLTPDVSVASDSKDQSHDSILEKAVAELVK